MIGFTCFIGISMHTHKSKTSSIKLAIFYCVTLKVIFLSRLKKKQRFNLWRQKFMASLHARGVEIEEVCFLPFPVLIARDNKRYLWPFVVIRNFWNKVSSLFIIILFSKSTSNNAVLNDNLWETIHGCLQPPKPWCNQEIMKYP